MKETGLTAEQCVFTDEALRKIISGYTREAGLRQLERAIGRVTQKDRAAIRRREDESCHDRRRTTFPRCSDRRFSRPNRCGAICLPESRPVWRGPRPGGDVLYIEATLLPDGKGMTLTGQLGEVMQESAKAAQSYIWSHASDFGIDPKAVQA